MESKPYKPQEPTSVAAAEPTVAYSSNVAAMSERRHLYHVTDAEREKILLAREQLARGEYYTEEEMDEMVKGWLN